MTRARIWAVVPVKGLGAAKQRLAPVLAPHLRRRLVLAMLGDVLGALADTPGLAGTLVISPDPDVLAVAGEAGAVAAAQAGNIGYAASAEVAACLAEAAHGATGVMVVPGDVPLAKPADFAAVLAAGAACALVPAWDGGTNCMLLSPPGAMRFLFGPNSFAHHQRAAEACGLTTRVLRRVGLARDIDEPVDLLRLAGQACGPHVGRLLAGWSMPALATCGGLQ